MAPTTRSARLSASAQTLSLEITASPKAKIVDRAICKVKIIQQESSLKVPGFKARKVLKPKVRRVTKEEKVAKKEHEDQMELEMEDLCTSKGSLMSSTFLESEVMAIRSSLLSWYDSNHRVLPWRINEHSCLENPLCTAGGSDEESRESSRSEVKKQDLHLQANLKDSKLSETEIEGNRAYAVWVSEMMLQQTRVATVINYYQRWMRTWPTVYDLAQASQEEVNTVWAGLGYYRRARFLLEGAKQIVQNLGGKFPRTVEELQKVPGIGTYTAGAIASIAFKQAVPVVDGNVVRVLCRLRAILLNPKSSTTVKLFWTLATQLVDQDRPGDFNQALMEIGATICTSTSPSCTSCPISSQCKALKLVNSVEQKVTSVTCFPAKVLKAAPREEHVAVCIVERQPETKNTRGVSCLLLVQRPLKGLLAGLWEFPSAPLDNSDSTEKARSIAMDKYLQNTLGIKLGGRGHSVVKREEIGTYVHVFSHIRLHMFVEWLSIRSEEVEGKSTLEVQGPVVTKWVDVDSMGSLGLTSGVKKVYKMFSGLRENQNSSSKVMKRKRS